VMQDLLKDRAHRYGPIPRPQDRVNSWVDPTQLKLIRQPTHSDGTRRHVSFASQP
jgi:hypothetical protein